MCIEDMVLILYGNSEHVAHAWRNIDIFVKKNLICDCSRSIKMPNTDQTAEIANYVRNYF